MDSKTLNFITEARKLYGERYDYSKIVYVRSDRKVTIICNEHGEFEMSPYYHLRGHGCPVCGRRKRLTTEDFILRSKSLYGDKFDYSKTEYVNSKTPVVITCPKHGEFSQKPAYHYVWCGCKKCSEEIKQQKRRHLTGTDFINKSKKIHGERYDYSKVVYKNKKTKVCITCKEHGDFLQSPKKHLLGQGCPICAKLKRHVSQRMDVDRFIKIARTKHGEKYDYTKVELNSCRDNVCIICPIHGEFYQNASAHLSGEGCRECSIKSAHTKQAKTTEQFIIEAIQVHSNHNYDYGSVKYKNKWTKVNVFCNEKFKDGTVHGLFSITPANLLKGRGCPKCHFSYLEQNVRSELTKHSIEFVEQALFDWLIGYEGAPYKLDFYLPKYKMAIECQGIQHFIPVSFGNDPENFKMSTEETAIENFKKQTQRDILKKTLCEQHGICVFYINYNDSVKHKICELITGYISE